MGGVWTGVAAGAGGLISALAFSAGGAMPTSAPLHRAQTAVPAVDSGSLCSPAEIPLFTCAIGVKRVSVCASGARATYRYGRPGKIELTAGTLTLASRAFSGGGETQITATNKGFSYTVFDRTTRTSFGDDGRHEPQSGTGLLVRRAGQTVSSRMCDDDTPIASRARTVLAPGAFVQH